ncbi:hypothetical protein [Synechocystis sp. LKSZ1]|uniref:hypothetical protein n=1 Tax=Synechocystis sp. LKSZ1 TaxID=3144951 RepID=UPI00336BE44F
MTSNYAKEVRKQEAKKLQYIALEIACIMDKLTVLKLQLRQLAEDLEQPIDEGKLS